MPRGTEHPAKLSGMEWDGGRFPKKEIGTSRWTREGNASQEEGKHLQILQSCENISEVWGQWVVQSGRAGRGRSFQLFKSLNLAEESG